jgi:hypothetical protein
MLKMNIGCGVTLATVLIISGSALHSVEGQSEAAVMEHANRAGATVMVENLNGHDVEIHLITSEGNEIRLGSVRDQGSHTFSLHDRLPEGTDKFRLKISCMWPSDPRTAVDRYHEAVETKPISAQSATAIEISVREPLRETIVATNSS